MTPSNEKKYRAIAIAKAPVAHAHIVELLVEIEEQVGLLRHVTDGTKRLYTPEEMEEHIALGRATKLGEKVSVKANTVALVLSEEAFELGEAVAAEVFTDAGQAQRTFEGHVVFFGEKNKVVRTRDQLAGIFVTTIKSGIVDRIIAEITDADARATWEELLLWTEFAIDCSGGSFENLFQPVLVRAYLLQHHLESTQVGNVYEVFIASHLSRAEFDRELNELEMAIRAKVERQLWRQSLIERIALQEEPEVGQTGDAANIVRIVDRPDPSKGHPRIPTEL